MPLPIAPSRRLPWDVDGSILWQKADAAGSPVILGATDRTKLNNEASDFYTPPFGLSDPGLIGIIFPEAKDIHGAFVSYLQGAGGALQQLEYSTDTTTGIDGTWTNLVANMPDDLPTSVWRTAIQSAFAAGCTGLRQRLVIGVTNRFANFHVYGVRAAGTTVDRLTFLDPIAEYTVPKDYGDQGQGAEIKTLMAIKNTSATLSAQTVTLSREGLTGPSVGWYQFSIDDSVYTDSLALGDIVPGGTQQFWIRQQISAVTGLGPEAARVLVDAVGGFI